MSSGKKRKHDEGNSKEGAKNTLGYQDAVEKFGKVFNDSVHGHIEFHPLLIKIIDTPEFQRLRFIKQLGMSYFVYPGAAHNRFEHSLGVGYLAGELVKSLRQKQQTLDITDVDVLCVEIAGLCHDLGHGPFSHLFDQGFLPKVRPDYTEQHEALSVKMFNHLVENNDLWPEFEKYGLTKEKDGIFIEEQILGSKERKEQWPYKGRDKEKSFLYEIVANKRNGIDVDKWDYFARDSHNLGIANPFDWRRYLKFARVIEAEDGTGKQICTRDKELTNLYDMFHTRYTLHKRAYQHRVTKLLETMLVEALVIADEHLFFTGKNGKKLKMSEAIDDMVAYGQLTDNIMWQILYTTDDKLDKAKSILEKIMKRKLYKFVGQTQLDKTNQTDGSKTPSKSKPQGDSSQGNITKDYAQEIYECLDPEVPNSLDKNDIVINLAKFNYGMGKNDPIEKVKFYPKSDSAPMKTVQLSDLNEDSMIIPRYFSEKFLRVFCKKTDNQSVDLVKEAFESWCKKEGHKPKAGAEGLTTTKKKPGQTSGVSRSQANKAKRRLVDDN